MSTIRDFKNRRRYSVSNSTNRIASYISKATKVLLVSTVCMMLFVLFNYLTANQQSKQFVKLNDNISKIESEIRELNSQIAQIDTVNSFNQISLKVNVGTKYSKEFIALPTNNIASSEINLQ